MSLPETQQKYVDEVKVKLLDFRGDKSQQRALADEITRKCVDLDLAYVEWTLCTHVVAHPSNRFGAGLDPMDVQELTADIVHDGWVWTGVGTPRGFEKQEQAAARILQEDFNIRIIKQAGGLLPEINRNDMRVLSVDCTHTATSVRTVEKGAKCAVAPVLDVNGKNIRNIADSSGNISRDHILMLCPSYKEPLDKGLKYTVFRGIVEVLIPDLPGFLAEAGNLSHGKHRQGTPVQLMLQLHQRGQHMKEATGDYGWQSIAENIEMSKPHLKGTVLDHCAFVEHYAGGPEATNLHDIEEFAKQLTTRCSVPGSLYRMLSTIPLVAQAPEFVVACAKAAMSIPPDCSLVVKGESKFVSSPDIPPLSNPAKSKGAVMTATKYIREAKSFLSVSSLFGPTQLGKVKVRGDLEVRLAIHVLKKKGKGIKEFKRMEDIMRLFTADANAIGFDTSSWPWQPEEAEATEEELPIILEHDKEGHLQVTAAYIKQQFQSMQAKCVNGKKVVISKILKDSVKLVGGLTVSFAAFIDEYKPLDAKDVFRVQMTDSCSPFKHPEYIADQHKAIVRKGLMVCGTNTTKSESRCRFSQRRASLRITLTKVVKWFSFRPHPVWVSQTMLHRGSISRGHLTSTPTPMSISTCI